MKKIKVSITLFFMTFFSLSATSAWAQVSAVYGGGPFYSGGQAVMDDLRSSGFNTVILWTLHVGPNGNMNLNNIPVIDTAGNYIGDPNWGNRVASLRQAPTSVNRIEIGVASAGVDDFENIGNLIDANGTGSNTVLYKAFQNLKTVTGADAINIDDESQFDVDTMVKFSVMMADIGYKVALVPYNRRSFWAQVYSQVETQRPGAIDRVYLQVYAGGSGNNPTTWNGSFGSLKVIPGVWSIHGSGCNQGDSPASVRTRMANWAPVSSGGFMWLYDDIQSCSAPGRRTADYAAAINGPVVTPPPTGFQNNIAPDASITVSSEYVDSNWSKEKITDGIVGQNGNGEWASDGEQRPFAQLDWSQSVEIDRVALYDRPNPFETITAGTLTFSDGSTVSVPALDNAGAARQVRFPEKTVTSVRFNVTSGSGPNVGLAEFEAFGETATTPPPLVDFTVNVAPSAVVSVSSEYFNPNWSKEKVTDGITGQNGNGEWASGGEQTPYVQLTWSKPFEIDRVVLFERPNLSERVLEGTLTFSDGSVISVTELVNAGAAMEIRFARKTVTSARFTVTSGVGPNVGLSEMRVFGQEK